MDERRSFGNSGEELAASFLQKQGFKILKRQYRSPFGEIDLIAEDPKRWIVFVEVKPRRSLESGYPEEAVTEQKRRHLEASGEYFLEEQALERRPYRFDVIAIVQEGEEN